MMVSPGDWAAWAVMVGVVLGMEGVEEGCVSARASQPGKSAKCSMRQPARQKEVSIA